MKLKRTATYFEFLDERGTRYVVRLNVGMRAGLVVMGPREESIEWRHEWGRYLPQSEATAETLVEEFCRRQLQRRPLELANAELLHPARKTRPIACACSDDHQLPIGDRV